MIRFAMKDTNQNNSELEKCVYCQRETDVEISTPIEHRNYYVEGVGQLCKNCNRIVSLLDDID